MDIHATRASSDLQAEIRLRKLAKAMLPQGAELGPENFAGDPLVKEFFEWASTRLGIAPSILVSWSCPPEVMLVESGPAQAIVRSERFDTLLVEYLTLLGAARMHADNDELRKDVTSTTILRWMSEFFLGFELPVCALATLIESSKLAHARLNLRPFRDESLATLPVILRAAVQCFCQAHEMAHLVQPPVSGRDLSFAIDGMELRKHVCRDLEEAGVDKSLWPAMLDILQIDVDRLIDEIDADCLALHLVAEFLFRHFDVSAEHIINMSLLAYSAQSFLHAAKHSCSLLRTLEGAEDYTQHIIRRDWVSSTQVSVRTRCILRRASMLMASIEDRTASPSVEKMRACVQRVDAMFIQDQRFLGEFSAAFHEKITWVIEAVWRGGGQACRDQFGDLLAVVAAKGDLRLDLFYILVAMGFPGGTDPIKYVNWIATRRN